MQIYLISLLLLSSILSTIFAHYTTNYINYKLLRITVNEQDYQWLEKLAALSTEYSIKLGRDQPTLDIWSEPNKLTNHVDVLVSPQFFPAFLDILRAKRFETPILLKNDIQKDIDRQLREYKRMRSRRNTQNVEDFDLKRYYNYDQMSNQMVLLAHKYSKFVSIINVTKTFENRDMIGLKIGSRDKQWKPAIFIDAGIHAREWIAPAVALFLMHKLITEYERNDRIKNLVDKFDWFIVPNANPDGYQYSIEHDRLWRKTRSQNGTNSTCIGTDANRNWGFRWGGAGANQMPCSNIYSGEAPFSEMEVAGLRDLIERQIPDLKLYISLHSYGQVFLAPWGYTHEKPKNYQDQKAAANKAIDAIRNVTGAEYDYGTIADVLYPASGTSIDYLQNIGVPYIFGIELRPQDNDVTYGFTLPSRFIQPTGEETLASVLAIAEHIVEVKRL